jgi:hypothetical protein
MDRSTQSKEFHVKELARFSGPNVPDAEGASLLAAYLRRLRTRKAIRPRQSTMMASKDAHTDSEAITLPMTVSGRAERTASGMRRLGTRD